MAKIVSCYNFDASPCGRRFELPFAHCLLSIACLVLPFLLSAQYRVQIKPVDKDSVFIYSTLRLDSNFRNQELAKDYVSKLPELLQAKGYPAASIELHAD